MIQSQGKKRVILVCNDSILIDYLRVAIESTNEFYLFHVFQDFDLLMINLYKYPASLIIFGNSTAELSRTFLKTKRRISNPMMVIGNTIHQDEILSMMQYGVSGYTEWVDVAKKLTRAIREIFSGRCFFDSKVVSLVILVIQLRAFLKTLAFITSTPAPSPEEKGKRSF